MDEGSLGRWWGLHSSPVGEWKGARPKPREESGDKWEAQMGAENTATANRAGRSQLSANPERGPVDARGGARGGSDQTLSVVKRTHTHAHPPRKSSRAHAEERVRGLYARWPGLDGSDCVFWGREPIRETRGGTRRLGCETKSVPQRPSSGSQPTTALRSRSAFLVSTPSLPLEERSLCALPPQTPAGLGFPLFLH